MKNIGIIMGGVMPVPAVCGGAIETLIESIVKQYHPDDGFKMTIFSVYHKDAVEKARQYPNVRFVWTHTNTFFNLSKHAVFLGVRELTGKTIRVLQRHYNEIAPVIQNEKFDLLIVEGGDEKAVIDIAKGYTRDQLVFHAHIHFIPKPEVVRGFGHMIGVSEFVTREYMNVCNVPVKPHVLKNAIDIKKFNKQVSEEEKKEIRNRLGLSEDDFVILFVGRIMEIKGVMELMKAVIELNDQHIKLMIMGSANSGKWAYSSYEKKVKKYADIHKKQIFFTGYVDNSEVYQYASVADIQCLPTLIAEAAPLVVFEAMAEGLPLVVTRSGGVVEYLDQDVALIIEQENVIQNLKDSILYMKYHPEIRKQMSENAKKRSIQYDEPMYYRNFVKVINEMAGE